MLSPARGFLMEKSTAQALPVLQQINASELKASHERPMQLCWWGGSSSLSQLRHRTLRSKYKRAALPPPNHFTPSFLSIFSKILTISFHCEDGICRIRLGEMLRQWTRTPCQYWIEKDSEDVWQYDRRLQVREEAGIPTGGFSR
jgi:hypothetical protein